MRTGSAAFSFGHYSLFKAREEFQVTRDLVVTEFDHELEAERDSEELPHSHGGEEEDSSCISTNSSFVYVTYDEDSSVVDSCHSEITCRGNMKIGNTLQDMSFDNLSVKEEKKKDLSSSEIVMDSPWLNVFEEHPEVDPSMDSVQEGYELIPALPLSPDLNVCEAATMSSPTNDIITSALPPSCSFMLNCQVIRRLLKVRVYR